MSLGGSRGFTTIPLMLHCFCDMARRESNYRLRVTKKTASAIGRAGEYLAAFILERNGIEVHHVDRSNYDLICRMRCGRLVKVQVKSSSYPRLRSEKHKTPVHRFCIGKIHDDIDCFVFVAIDVMMIRIKTAEQAKTKCSAIDVDEFNEQRQAEDIESFKLWFGEQ